MITLIIALFFFALIVFLAIHFSMQSKTRKNQPLTPSIYQSGIYSIIRKSPRQTLGQTKPAIESVEEFLNTRNDCNNNSLKQDWQKNIEYNIQLVEKGDEKGQNIYILELSPKCSICNSFFKNPKMIISREEIHKNSAVLPPFYPGCSCTLSMPEKFDQMPILPKIPKDTDGNIRVPDWKQI
ncbi:MAG: hypothetical protein ABIA63_08945 [bacterium]